MKPHLPLLAVSALLLAACVSPLPAWGEGPGVRATPTPTLTSTPTRTPTPAPTPTPSVTPTPSLPPEALTRLAGRDWRIEGDKVVAGGVAWYTQDAEGQWQPAQFIIDFDKHRFSLEGLETAATETGIQLVDPATGKVVYNELGKFDIYWVVENFNTKEVDLMPTDIKPIKGLGGPKDAIYMQYFSPMFYEIEKKMHENGVAVDEKLNAHMIILLDPKKLAWGHILGAFSDDYKTAEQKYFAYQLASGEIRWLAVWTVDDYDALIEFLKERAQLAFEEEPPEKEASPPDESGGSN